MPCALYRNSLSDSIKPDPTLTYTQWADSYFSLPRESTAEYGRFRSSRTPFIREILDELSPSSPTEVVVLIKPTQLAGTTIALIFLTGMIDLYPGPALMILPTDALARSFSKKKLEKTIKAVLRLQGKVKLPKSRDSGNTILQKEYPGGSLMLTGSNSGASYRSESIKYLVLDDFDGFEIDIGGEGSPEELADRRTGSFPGRKIFINSTITKKGASNIEQAFEHSSQGLFNVPCPHCGTLQYLEWGGVDAEFGIKFKRDENGIVVDAWYQCNHCRKRIDESAKPGMAEAGVFVHECPERKVRGYKYNALVTPIGWINSWVYISQKYVEAVAELRKGKPAKYITWLNSFMSEAYEERGDQPDWVVLKTRAEPYKFLTVPKGGFFLTMGTDTQDNRLVVVIRAWGKYEESWLVYCGELWGDPEQPEVWVQHDQLLSRPFPHVDGSELHIISSAVDTGGHKTQAVYNYCRIRAPRVIAVKGASQTGKPVVGRPTQQDVTWKGEKIVNGVQLWPLGVDTAKGVIYSRLKQSKPGPGCYHWPMGIEDDYYMQLTAEKQITRYHKGFPKSEWVKVRERNDYLDAEIYAYCAAIRAGMALINWDKLTTQKPTVQKPPGKANAARSKWMEV